MPKTLLGFGKLQDWFDLSDLPAWRQRLVDFAFFLAALVFPLSMMANLPVYLRQEHYNLILVDGVLWVLCLLLAFGSLRRFVQLRLALMLTLLYAMTTTFFVILGPDQARPAWLVLCAVFGALLYGVRGALAATLINAVLLMGVYYLTTHQTQAWETVHAKPMGDWIWFVTNTCILAFVASASVGLLLGGLDRSLKKERAAHRRLLEETEHRKKLQAHLQRAQKLEAIGRFASGIAHDLNNMLMPVIAYTEMVASTLPKTGKSHQQLQAVLQSGQRASELVSQILTFGRAVESARSGVDLDPLLDELGDMLQPKMGPHIKLSIQRPEEKLPPILANRTALVQVLQNLCLNAIDAMPDGGSLTIRIGLDQTPVDNETQMQILVEDTGCGMDADTATKAFDPFFSTKAPGRGSGLGLATVHGIVTALGGSIDLDSAPGQGSRFKLHLPLASQSNSEDQVPPPPEVLKFQGQVLLVDDDDASRAAIAAMLKSLGFRVEAMAGGRQALERLKQGFEPNIIVTDWLMPDMGGEELVRALRKEHPKLPILAVSGSASAEMSDLIDELNILGLLPKPFNKQVITQAITNNLPHLQLDRPKT